MKPLLPALGGGALNIRKTTPSDDLLNEHLMQQKPSDGDEKEEN